MEGYKITQHIMDKCFYAIKNEGALKNIVLFGNCQNMLIGDYLNQLMKGTCNIYVIFSYLRTQNQPFTDDEKKLIWNLIAMSDYFIHHKHINDFDIDAANIARYAKNKVICIPNFFSRYTNYRKESPEIFKTKYRESLQKCIDTIRDSDVQNFSFIPENHHKIRFFNTISHPTNYTLYLLALQLHNFITDSPKLLMLEDYYACKEDDLFLRHKPISMTEYMPYKREECELLGIDKDSEYFDCDFFMKAVKDFDVYQPI